MIKDCRAHRAQDVLSSSFFLLVSKLHLYIESCEETWAYELPRNWGGGFRSIQGGAESLENKAVKTISLQKPNASAFLSRISASH